MTTLAAPLPNPPCINNTSITPDSSQIVSNSNIERVIKSVTDATKRLSQAESTISTNANTQSSKRKTRDTVGPWKLGKTLGKGSSGRVRLAKNMKTGQLAAIKIVPKNFHSKKKRQDSPAKSLSSSPDKPYTTHSNETNPSNNSYGIEREIVIMKLISHPNVMGLYEVWENKSELYLVLEYVDGGELFDYLVSRGKLPEREAVHYFKQIIQGVAYCHAFNICHRDLKPENLLLDKKNKIIKIADFGMAALEVSDKLLSTSCGSPHYASPEIVMGKSYHGSPTDVWSCGIILFALLTGHLPFNHDNIKKLLLKVQSGVYHMPSDLSPDAKDLISKILVVDPDKRLTTTEILNHSLITKYDRMGLTNRNYNNNLSMARDKSNSNLNFINNLSNVDILLQNPCDIDTSILSNLQILWHGESKHAIIDKLLQPNMNEEKLFYSLLLKYKQKNSKFFPGNTVPSTSANESLLPPPGISNRSNSPTIQNNAETPFELESADSSTNQNAPKLRQKSQFSLDNMSKSGNTSGTASRDNSENLSTDISDITYENTYDVTYENTLESSSQEVSGETSEGTGEISNESLESLKETNNLIKKSSNSGSNNTTDSDSDEINILIPNLPSIAPNFPASTPRSFKRVSSKVSIHSSTSFRATRSKSIVSSISKRNINNIVSPNGPSKPISPRKQYKARRTLQNSASKRSLYSLQSISKRSLNLNEFLVSDSKMFPTQDLPPLPTTLGSVNFEDLCDQILFGEGMKKITESPQDNKTSNGEDFTDVSSNISHGTITNAQEGYKTQNNIPVLKEEGVYVKEVRNIQPAFQFRNTSPDTHNQSKNDSYFSRSSSEQPSLASESMNLPSLHLDDPSYSEYAAEYTTGLSNIIKKNNINNDIFHTPTHELVENDELKIKKNNYVTKMEPSPISALNLQTTNNSHSSLDPKRSLSGNNNNSNNNNESLVTSLLHSSGVSRTNRNSFLQSIKEQDDDQWFTKIQNTQRERRNASLKVQKESRNLINSTPHMSTPLEDTNSNRFELDLNRQSVLAESSAIEHPLLKMPSSLLNSSMTFRNLTDLLGDTNSDEIISSTKRYSQLSSAVPLRKQSTKISLTPKSNLMRQVEGQPAPVENRISHLDPHLSDYSSISYANEMPSATYTAQYVKVSNGNNFNFQDVSIPSIDGISKSEESDIAKDDTHTAMNEIASVIAVNKDKSISDMRSSQALEMSQLPTNTNVTNTTTENGTINIFEDAPTDSSSMETGSSCSDYQGNIHKKAVSIDTLNTSNVILPETNVRVSLYLNNNSTANANLPRKTTEEILSKFQNSPEKPLIVQRNHSIQKRWSKVATNSNGKHLSLGISKSLMSMFKDLDEDQEDTSMINPNELLSQGIMQDLDKETSDICKTNGNIIEEGTDEYHDTDGNRNKNNRVTMLFEEENFVSATTSNNSMENKLNQLKNISMENTHNEDEDVSEQISIPAELLNKEKKNDNDISQFNDNKSRQVSGSKHPYQPVATEKETESNKKVIPKIVLNPSNNNNMKEHRKDDTNIEHKNNNQIPPPIPSIPAPPVRKAPLPPPTTKPPVPLTNNFTKSNTKSKETDTITKGSKNNNTTHAKKSNWFTKMFSGFGSNNNSNNNSSSMSSKQTVVLVKTHRTKLKFDNAHKLMLNEMEKQGIKHNKPKSHRSKNKLGLKSMKSSSTKVEYECEFIKGNFKFQIGIESNNDDMSLIIVKKKGKYTVDDEMVKIFAQLNEDINRVILETEMKHSSA
ncbi:hypothetical protein TBLA_0I01150 [Henningerozyma blattae CBS 6284]|uniref:non-specific serine/threonine protein kinase n=1 Tax=Henningerozyma blattae (strain ATCC 34711 / CBS 6284 / DSM 70876 / NBRC 10599 / NRRL Y-10934 / UCD 77-7) TaxID=1071380 RepID=I2H8S3_HENB6|nr:hypothetical protein TBLA_0I01150 [Tetrapisispora blattae CBS 6284]CCH62775.1 hypothetical protein TBLA_0I01150 [Tetrapisispora blattae CBS 6284]